MQELTRIAEVRAALAPHRGAGQRIGFVPTMGFLHDGHLALVRRARAECPVVVVSVFVNPLQFGPGEDYHRYPRDPARDRALLAAAGVDYLFMPPVEEMYPGGESWTVVDLPRLAAPLCGRSRPGHFRGVATVVCKLLNIVRPDRAYFGEKDYQQLLVVRRMVEDLNMEVAVVGVPTVREPDGLALSSRNTYLSPAGRVAARSLSQALGEGRRLVLDLGERDPRRVRATMWARLEAEPLVRPDYAEVVDAETLESLPEVRGRVLLAVAAYVESARLIDNMVLQVPGARVPQSPGTSRG